VPTLTPEQLREARGRSGRLGGRPRKPTVEEARRAALAPLVTAAIKSLPAHLGDGDPAAWRAGFRVLELLYGKPSETLDVDATLVDPLRIREMTSGSGQC
jgi:hypothetical protein